MKMDAFGVAQLGRVTPFGNRLEVGDIGTILELAYYTRSGGTHPDSAVYLSREQARDLAEYLRWWLSGECSTCGARKERGDASDCDDCTRNRAMRAADSEVSN